MFSTRITGFGLKNIFRSGFSSLRSVRSIRPAAPRDDS